MFIHVPKWREYQARRDLKQPWWFRLDHSLFLSTKDLNQIQTDEVMAWLYILCLCSDANRDSVEISQQHHSVFGRIPYENFLRAVEKLENLNWIKTFTRSDQIPSGTVQDSTVQDSIGATSPAEPREVIAELADVRDILEGRGISTKLQRMWIADYSQEFVVQKIKDLKKWELTAGAKGKKKNWGRFYNNCFSKDWDDYSKRLPGGTNSQPPKKSAWARMKEEGKV